MARCQIVHDVCVQSSIDQFSLSPPLRTLICLFICVVALTPCPSPPPPPTAVQYNLLLHFYTVRSMNLFCIATIRFGWIAIKQRRHQQRARRSEKQLICFALAAILDEKQLSYSRSELPSPEKPLSRCREHSLSRNH